MSMDTEEMIRAQPMDSVVLIGGCDKTLPAQLMAAASADRAGDRDAGRPDAGRSLQGRAARRLHRLSPQLGASTAPARSTKRKSTIINERLAPTVGHLHGDGHGQHHGLHHRGAGHGAARQRHDPGRRTPTACAAPKQSGKRAAEMAAKGGPRPAKCMTPAAFRNALVVLQALGGSTNGLIHLTAIAGRVGVKDRPQQFDRSAAKCRC